MSLTYIDFLEQKKAKFIEECDLCGNCLKKCPMIPHSNLKGYKAIELQEKIIAYFKEDAFSQEVIDFAQICSNCRQCDMVCPVEGLCPGCRSEIVKGGLYVSGKKITESAAYFLPGERYFAFEVLASLVMKPSEIRWLEEIPEKQQKTEIVYFLGCVAQSAPDKVFTSMDILSQVTQDFVTLNGGVKACCGGLHTFLGQSEGGDNLAKKLLGGIETIFQPRAVVFWCPTCLSLIKNNFSSYTSDSLKYQHISSFLADNLESLSFKHSINRTITVHDSCHLARGVGEYDAPRKILSRIPGVNLVEMKHTKEKTLCCGAAAGFFDPGSASALASQRLDEAKESGAEVIATLCQSCATSFSPGEFTHGLSSKFLTDLVGEAMGIHYEDKFKELVALGSPEKIIEAAGDNIEASKYTVDEMRTVLPNILGI